MQTTLSSNHLKWDLKYYDHIQMKVLSFYMKILFETILG